MKTSTRKPLYANYTLVTVDFSMLTAVHKNIMCQKGITNSTRKILKKRNNVQISQLSAVE